MTSDVYSEAIRFEEQDLNDFSSASGDVNPLHLSPDYASRTAYGQPVVFGALEEQWHVLGEPLFLAGFAISL